MASKVHDVYCELAFKLWNCKQFQATEVDAVILQACTYWDTANVLLLARIFQSGALGRIAQVSGRTLLDSYDSKDDFENFRIPKKTPPKAQGSAEYVLTLSLSIMKRCADWRSHAAAGRSILLPRWRRTSKQMPQ